MVNTIIKKITVGVPIRGVTSGAFAITNLGGVDVTGVGEGDMLVYDASQAKFLADSDTYLKTTDSAEVKAMFSASGDLTYNSSTGQFSIDVEAVYTKANFDSDLDAATAAGSIAFNDGTASLPSIANTGDTNTGFHFPAADKIGFTVGGASQFTVSDGVISPVTDNDVDLGTSSLEFKDLYLDGTAHIDTLDVDANATIAGTLDVTGVATATTFEPDGDTAAGDNAAIGFTSAEGLILTGQGSTNDVTIKNDADAAVIQIPTGTTGVTMAGTLGVTGKITADAGVDIDNFNIDGTTIALSSGNMTLDVAGNVTFDSGNGDFFFKDGSLGANFCNIYENNSDLFILNPINNERVIIQGIDDNAGVNALIFDMADAGTAIFNHDAQFPDGAQVRLGADNDMKLHLDGTTAIFGAQNGDMLLDSAADITIDCTDEINLFQGGTPRGVITMGDAFVTFGSSNNNGDVRIMGIDGGAAITALSFDMSEAGAARFIGNLVCGTTTGITNATGFSTGASGGQANTFNLTSTNEIHIYNNNNSSGATYKIQFRQNNTAVGTISASSNATAYATSSDYRLKENVDYDWDATTRLKQLKPARFNWITDDSNTLVDGFLAHEAQTVVPESVVGEKDAIRPEVLYVEDESLPDGKNVGDVKEASAPDYQQIDQAKLVPLLVKTIQELEARITTLEG